MSRRSAEFARGTQKFSWTLSKFTDADGRERFKAQCLNTDIAGIGDSEQEALQAGVRKVAEAAEKAEIGTTPAVGISQESK